MYNKQVHKVCNKILMTVDSLRESITDWYGYRQQQIV